MNWNALNDYYESIFKAFSSLVAHEIENFHVFHQFYDFHAILVMNNPIVKNNLARPNGQEGPHTEHHIICGDIFVI